MLSLPDLCDKFPDSVTVTEPVFTDYGATLQFNGEIVTLKCFEDNSLVKEAVALPGTGKVLVIDGGGSLRRALLGDLLAETAAKNGWQGFLIYGCVRDVELLKTINVGIKALNVHPMKTDKRGEGQKNIVVKFSGVDFIPGEFLYADENGILVSGQKLV